MSFSNRDIRTLRQRLGWSVPEMARQMGCKAELIARWESGADLPDSEALNHLRYLSNYIEAASQHILEEPVIEKEIELRRVAQLTHRDLLKDS